MFPDDFADGIDERTSLFVVFLRKIPRMVIVTRAPSVLKGESGVSDYSDLCDVFVFVVFFRKYPNNINIKIYPFYLVCFETLVHGFSTGIYGVSG